MYNKPKDLFKMLPDSTGICSAFSLLMAMKRLQKMHMKPDFKCRSANGPLENPSLVQVGPAKTESIY